MDLNYPVIYIDYFHDYIYVKGEPVHISKFSPSVSSFRLNSIFDSSVTTYTRTHDGYIKGNYLYKLGNKLTMKKTFLKPNGNIVCTNFRETVNLVLSNGNKYTLEKKYGGNH